MREIYRGNGFIITTNDSGEIFVAMETSPNHSLRISSHQVNGMSLSYTNSGLQMIPTGFKTLRFMFA